MPSTRNGGGFHAPTAPSSTTPGVQDIPSKDQKDTKGEEDDSSASEEDSFSYDEGESERIKSKCLDDMVYLEHQFSELKELLYKERMDDVEHRLNLLSKDSAPEYVNPLKELTDYRDKRLLISDLVLNYKELSVEHKYEQEISSAELDYIESCELCKMKLLNETEEKIHRLEEEEILSNISTESSNRKRKSKISEFILLEKRKKPVTVNGPYIIYMLRDMEIMEDVNDIRKGIAVTEIAKRRRKLY